jgi:hypothetical protein
MGRARAEPIERRVMLFDRIPLVVGEPITGMARVEHPHHRVALDLRED